MKPSSSLPQFQATQPQVGSYSRSVEPPRLPEILLDWMDADWKTQQDPRPAPQRDAELEGEIKAEQFEDLPERVAAYTGWLPGFKAWSTADRSARAALKLFEKLYEVHGILQRENELWELAVGDGFLFHAPAQVEHPLLIHALQLDFDPKVPAFTVTTALKSSEIYVALLTILGLDGRHLNALQEELEGGAYSPLGAEETTAFLKGLVQRFGNGVFCESKATAPTDSPTLFRKPVLFLRRPTPASAGRSPPLPKRLTQEYSRPRPFSRLLVRLVPVLMRCLQPPPSEGATWANTPKTRILLRMRRKDWAGTTAMYCSARNRMRNNLRSPTG
ncbi:hypothetical protein [Tunturiibacter gelidiferens]|uniref:Uncharacterized protein n=1 Tax=Tunturiibacter gelidiferens TaxID=3069689 RepID=A0AAU7Z711_9BACT